MLSFIPSDTQPAQDANVRGSAGEAFAAPTTMLVEAALRGESGSNVATRGYAFIAAEPVLFKGEVVGAVVVQKSERALLALH